MSEAVDCRFNEGEVSHLLTAESGRKKKIYFIAISAAV
jgi:hypothetical protein